MESSTDPTDTEGVDSTEQSGNNDIRQGLLVRKERNGNPNYDSVSSRYGNERYENGHSNPGYRNSYGSSGYGNNYGSSGYGSSYGSSGMGYGSSYGGSGYGSSMFGSGFGGMGLGYGSMGYGGMGMGIMGGYNPLYWIQSINYSMMAFGQMIEMLGLSVTAVGRSLLQMIKQVKHVLYQIQQCKYMKWVQNKSKKSMLFRWTVILLTMFIASQSVALLKQVYEDRFCQCGNDAGRSNIRSYVSNVLNVLGLGFLTPSLIGYADNSSFSSYPSSNNHYGTGAGLRVSNKEAKGANQRGVLNGSNKSTIETTTGGYSSHNNTPPKDVSDLPANKQTKELEEDSGRDCAVAVVSCIEKGADIGKHL